MFPPTAATAATYGNTLGATGTGGYLPALRSLWRAAPDQIPVRRHSSWMQGAYSAAKARTLHLTVLLKLSVSSECQNGPRPVAFAIGSGFGASPSIAQHRRAFVK